MYVPEATFTALFVGSEYSSCGAREGEDSTRPKAPLESCLEEEREGEREGRRDREKRRGYREREEGREGGREGEKTLA